MAKIVQTERRSKARFDYAEVQPIFGSILWNKDSAGPSAEAKPTLDYAEVQPIFGSILRNKDSAGPSVEVNKLASAESLPPFLFGSKSSPAAGKNDKPPFGPYPYFPYI